MIRVVSRDSKSWINLFHQSDSGIPLQKEKVIACWYIFDRMNWTIPGLSGHISTQSPEVFEPEIIKGSTSSFCKFVYHPLNLQLDNIFPCGQDELKPKSKSLSTTQQSWSSTFFPSSFHSLQQQMRWQYVLAGITSQFLSTFLPFVCD